MHVHALVVPHTAWGSIAIERKGTQGGSAETQHLGERSEEEILVTVYLHV
jgi:hypothetical protein